MPVVVWMVSQHGTLCKNDTHTHINQKCHVLQGYNVCLWTLLQVAGIALVKAGFWCAPCFDINIWFWQFVCVVFFHCSCNASLGCTRQCCGWFYDQHAFKCHWKEIWKNPKCCNVCSSLKGVSLLWLQQKSFTFVQTEPCENCSDIFWFIFIYII